MRSMLLIWFLLLFACQITAKDERNSFYVTNQNPLVAQPYTQLPLGAIKPHGMLLSMLEAQRDGLTGHFDYIYSLVCVEGNCLLVGKGDGWERGPYWLDGLVPLAYILDDNVLKAKAQRWIEWCFANQREDGYFGPQELPDGYEYIPGTQQDMREDWWPKMVMLKVLQQYYTATEDERVIKLMDRYFRYQLKMLPKYPLKYWTYWAEQRGADNLAVVYWLYNITREKYLLELAELIHSQTYNWTEVFTGNTLRILNPMPDLHCVNVAQGLKAPLIYYQQHTEQKYVDAVKLGLAALKDCHGFVNGMYGGDEQLHGNDPTQGSELCSAVEMMYSFESIIPITGDVYYADYLEKIAYNVLPTQITDDFMERQYFQQANQVQITLEERNFMNQAKTGLVFGTTIGYPCCTCNMHQAWPKYVQNLWYATADDGIAALVYGESEVEMTVVGNHRVKVVEQTDYPFKENIRFVLSIDNKVKFPFHLRIPLWCKDATILVNGKVWKSDVKNNIAIINREWSNGDIVELNLPMDVRYSYWAQNSIGIERGPLVYALKIEEEWKRISQSDADEAYWEVLPKSDWNYALLKSGIEQQNLKIEVKDEISNNPWNLDEAPIKMLIPAIKIPQWKLERGSTGKLPANTKDLFVNGNVENVTLIPYGCTTLRISEFPIR